MIGVVSSPRELRRQLAVGNHASLQAPSGEPNVYFKDGVPALEILLSSSWPAPLIATKICLAELKRLARRYDLRETQLTMYRPDKSFGYQRRKTSTTRSSPE